MEGECRFRDEWLLQAARRLPRATEAAIETLRGERPPYLSQALIKAGLSLSAQNFVVWGAGG
ncbi:MAG: hypothetical protein HY550_09985 [Elusimicrobia bacterium]|nr:hypothetical protein [Elusimicrobiota bacterium]